MTASSRGPQAIVSALRRSPPSSLCIRCATHSRTTAAIRSYSSVTPSTASIPETSSTSANILSVTTGVESPPPEETSAIAGAINAKRYPQREKSLYRLQAGLILSRPPLLMREQTPFESAFYLYQKRLNERLTTPFAQQFFFREGQPAGIDFRIKWLERRRTMTREIGRVNRGGPYEWDDELLINEGKELADPDAIREKLYLEAESRVSEDGERLSFEDRLRIERPFPRQTEADKKGDVTRLDRKLDRTLYLVVRRSGNPQWEFPKSTVRPEELLHDTAQRALAEAAGVNMNIWFIGRHPIAYEEWNPVYEGEEGNKTLARRGLNVFYLRAKIMAGQADLTNNEYSADAFKWLTREEVQEHVHPNTFESVEKTMPER